MSFDKTGAVRAKKSLGQHFLTDLNIARKIADAVSRGAEIANRCNIEVSDRSARIVSLKNEGKSEYHAGKDGMELGPNGLAIQSVQPTELVDVLEIGGGMGVLTQFLLERDDIRLWGIEIDRESIAYMREHFPGFATGGENDTGRLIEGDFLRFDLRARFPAGVTIAGNFPYNISSQIFFKVLENRDIVPEVVGMVQREVAQRIAEKPGSRTYGILSVLLQAWYGTEYLFTVGEGVFSPPPKVKSAVIRLRRNEVKELGCDEELFVKVVKAAFGQRRKMLRNALRAVFGDFGGAQHPLFGDRAERLSVAAFVELTNWVAANAGKPGATEKDSEIT